MFPKFPEFRDFEIFVGNYLCAIENLNFVMTAYSYFNQVAFKLKIKIWQTLMISLEESVFGNF